MSIASLAAVVLGACGTSTSSTIDISAAADFADLAPPSDPVPPDSPQVVSADDSSVPVHMMNDLSSVLGVAEDVADEVLSAVRSNTPRIVTSRRGADPIDSAQSTADASPTNVARASRLGADATVPTSSDSAIPGDVSSMVGNGTTPALDHDANQPSSAGLALVAPAATTERSAPVAHSATDAESTPAPAPAPAPEAAQAQTPVPTVAPKPAEPVSTEPEPAQIEDPLADPSDDTTDHTQTRKRQIDKRIVPTPTPTSDVVERVTASGLPEPTWAPATVPTTVLPSPISLIEARGNSALSRISYDWRALGFSIEFLPERSGFRGLTFPYENRIEVYVSDSLTDSHLAHVIAHEIGHMIDVRLNDADDRRRWLTARGLPTSTQWWAGEAVSDFASGSGDFAECFATWQLGTQPNSKLAPSCSGTATLLAELVKS